MAKDKKKQIATPAHDDLTQLIHDSLNKLFEDDGQVAYFLDGSQETPLDLTTFISTGATMLDLAISNRPHGGIPVGRILEITGLEGSGKSLLGASLIRQTQLMGGIAILIDTEMATNEQFLEAQGIDVKALIVMNLDTIEDVFSSITHIVEKIRSGGSDKFITIVVDSIAGASTKQEMESDFSKEGYATAKALIIGKAMRKLTGMIGRQKIALIFTNQLRHKMNAMPFADPWTTSGGKAIAFHSSVRIRLSQTGKLKDSDGNIMGVSVRAQVTKNRVGPPHREAAFDIYFNRGIDDYSSWLSSMKDQKLIKQAGAWYSFTDEAGTETKFQSKDFKAFIEENKARKEFIYKKICEETIMKYEKEIDPDAVIRAEATDDE
jgi:recombination protein RecA